MDWKTFMELLNVIIWPLVVGIALFIYRKSLANIITGLGHRVTRLSAFDISIELAALPTLPSPWSDYNIPVNSEMTGGEANNSAFMTLFEHIKADIPWDYMIIDIKDCHFWFVSRVFIFTFFLQAMRGLKCVVFVQTSDESYRRLIGISSSKAVRSALGRMFPWMEKALKNALSEHKTCFLDPELPPSTAGNIIQSFIKDRDMRLTCKPDDLTNTTSKCTIPKEQLPTDPIKPDEWVRLRDKNIWEHTYWLDFGIRQVSEAVTKSFYERDSSHYMDSPDVSNEERTRALLFRKAPYIALVNSQREFKALIDRQKLVALIGESLIKERCGQIFYHDK